MLYQPAGWPVEPEQCRLPRDPFDSYPLGEEPVEESLGGDPQGVDADHVGEGAGGGSDEQIPFRDDRAIAFDPERGSLLHPIRSMTIEAALSASSIPRLASRARSSSSSAIAASSCM